MSGRLPSLIHAIHAIHRRDNREHLQLLDLSTKHHEAASKPTLTHSYLRIHFLMSSPNQRAIHPQEPDL